MKLRKLKKALLLGIVLSAFGLGCELIVDFDRSRIPVEGTDATPTIDATLDVINDQGTTDAADAGDASDGNKSDAQPDADAADDAPDGD
ncbi:MAG: hypothetical protein JST00_41610 [Deltaproteobacteria bacterium]|nr:hypothetical protein [Deltaproteobacteria bacterium]